MDGYAYFFGREMQLLDRITLEMQLIYRKTPEGIFQVAHGLYFDNITWISRSNGTLVLRAVRNDIFYIMVSRDANRWYMLPDTFPASLDRPGFLLLPMQDGRIMAFYGMWRLSRIMRVYFINPFAGETTWQVVPGLTRSGSFGAWSIALTDTELAFTLAVYDPASRHGATIIRREIMYTSDFATWNIMPYVSGAWRDIVNAQTGNREASEPERGHSWGFVGEVSGSPTWQRVGFVPGTEPIRAIINGREFVFDIRTPGLYATFADGELMIPYPRFGLSHRIYRAMGFHTRTTAFDYSRRGEGVVLETVPDDMLFVRGNLSVMMNVGSPYFTTVHNGVHTTHPLAVSVQYVPMGVGAGHWLIPIQAFAEAVGDTFHWDAARRVFTITTAEFEAQQLAAQQLTASSPYARELFGFINAERAKIGVADLSWDVFSGQYANMRGLFNLINAERAGIGAHEFIWSNMLATSAHMHARDMAVNNFVSLYGSDGTHRDRRIHHVTYNVTGGRIYAGELGYVHVGTDNPHTAFRGLMPPGRNSWLTHGPDDGLVLTHAGIGFYHYQGRLKFYVALSVR